MQQPSRGIWRYTSNLTPTKTSRAACAAWGVVAVAGTRDESAAAARRDDLHLHGAECAIALGVGRIVGQRVLIANVVRDLLADVVHVFDVLREVSEATRGFGNFLERALGALGALFAFFA